MSAKDIAAGLSVRLGDAEEDRPPLFHIRGGRVTRLVTYLDRERAIADLGLSREGQLLEFVVRVRNVGLLYLTAAALREFQQRAVFANTRSGSGSITL